MKMTMTVLVMVSVDALGKLDAERQHVVMNRLEIVAKALLPEGESLMQFQMDEYTIAFGFSKTTLTEAEVES